MKCNQKHVEHSRNSVACFDSSAPSFLKALKLESLYLFFNDEWVVYIQNYI